MKSSRDSSWCETRSLALSIIQLRLELSFLMLRLDFLLGSDLEKIIKRRLLSWKVRFLAENVYIFCVKNLCSRKSKNKRWLRLRKSNVLIGLVMSSASRTLNRNTSDCTRLWITGKSVMCASESWLRICGTTQLAMSISDEGYLDLKKIESVSENY